MNKLKNKNIVTIIVMVILLLSSVFMYNSYPKIEKTMNDIESNRLISNYIANQSSYYNYVIDSELKNKHGLNSDLKQYIELKDGDQKYIEEDIGSFASSLNYYKHDLKNNSDIKYYAVDNQKHSISNSKDNLKNINDDQSLQKKYRFFVQIHFDQAGNFDVLSMSSLNGYDIESFINDYQEYELTENTYIHEDGTVESVVQYKRPKNITITYAVPTKLSPATPLTMQLFRSGSPYLKYTLPYILSFVILTMLITFFMPITILKENKFLKFIINIKFEILGTIWCFITFIMSLAIPALIGSTILDMFFIIYKDFGIESIGYILTPGINFLFWFVYFGLFMILAYCIKYLFHIGFKQYFMDHTCLGWLFKKFKQLMNYATQIDFKKNTNKTVLKIVIVNFVIISIISFFWTFGILFAIFYSIIIFIILKKKFDEIQDDYKVLLDATKELSNGHFDVHINQDVGVFNPLKDEFSHIKDGFEKAVNEEVKSQKMKTELISNVSHDLKTPLTSIITYIDLLKNTGLSEEEKQNYIQVIDRNSLRLKNLIDDLFEVSKANSGDIKLDLVDVDIVSLIKQAQFECGDKFEEKQLDLRMNSNQEKIICHLDSFKTYRIFENLFMNISKYAMAHTRVYIDIIDYPDNVTITFKNISESEMNFNENEIVERFVQGDKSRNASGSGLGLAIVKSFTELQNGQFKVDIDGDLFKSTLIFNK